MAIRHYRALLAQGADGTWGVVFPEFPGCVSAGDDVNHALRMATEALWLHATSMVEDFDPRDPLPDPVPLDAPLPDWMVEGEAAEPDALTYSRDLRALIPVDLPEPVLATAA